MIRSFGLAAKPSLRNQWISTSFYSTVLNPKVDDVAAVADPEWNNAKPFSEIPGPSKLSFVFSFLPGGKFHNAKLPEVITGYRKEYGEIYKLPGILGKSDTVVTFDPNNFQKIFRTEGQWPERQILESILYHRQKHRPELSNQIGLALTQGKPWGDIRSIANPVMMQPKTVKLYVSNINVIGDDIVKCIRDIRDPKTLVSPPTFEDEINSWALEQICLIALDTRLGLIGRQQKSPEAQKLIDGIKIFFSLLSEMDLKIPFWKAVKTPNFKKYMKALDDINDVTSFYIEKAKTEMESEPESEAKNQEDSVLKKLLKVNVNFAKTMAQDMLTAGVDTTSSAFVALTYHLSRNPEKQKILQEELKTILPNKDSPLTPENMSRLPYLRACYKEATRLTPVAGANSRHTGQNLVLSGYQIPKGVTAVMPSEVLQLDDRHYPKAKEFIPERWLKNQPEGCPNAKTANPFIFLPFGFGPRSCIGKRFAELEIEVMTSKIFRNFFVEWAGEGDLKFKNTAINVPDGELLFKFTDLEN